MEICCHFTETVSVTQPAQIVQQMEGPAFDPRGLALGNFITSWKCFCSQLMRSSASCLCILRGRSSSRWFPVSWPAAFSYSIQSEPSSIHTGRDNAMICILPPFPSYWENSFLAALIDWERPAGALAGGDTDLGVLTYPMMWLQTGRSSYHNLPPCGISFQFFGRYKQKSIYIVFQIISYKNTFPVCAFQILSFPRNSPLF